jgi:hypothetical protein
MLRKAILSTGIEGQRRIFVHKLLWFLRMTIRGETFPYGRIEEDKWPGVLVQLTEWLTKRAHLQELLEDDMTLFEVIWLLYESGKPVEVLRA